MYKKLDEKGQTILITVLVMIVALSIGIAISSRFIKNLSLDVQTDSSYRAQAVAEAAIERLLIIEDSVLEDYAQYGTCGSNCILTITGADGVVATANVVLSYVGNTSSAVDVPLSINDSAEVNLNTYGNNALDICWDDPSGSPKPAVRALFVYGTDGSYAVDNYAVNSESSSEITNGFDFASAANGFQSCFTVSGRDNPQLLRLRSLYQDVKVYIVPSTGATIPSQGIKMESTGTVLDSVKKVTVVKSTPTLPAEFDFTVFSRSESDPLTNINNP